MEINNIVEICKRKLEEKVKYLYDNSEDYIQDLSNYLTEDAIEKEFQGIISPRLAYIITKLIVYSDAYVSFSFATKIYEDFEFYEASSYYIELLSLEKKIDREIREHVLKEFVEFTMKNYLEKHLAYESILDSLSTFLSINPFGIFSFQEILQDLTTEEETIITILEMYEIAESKLNNDSSDEDFIDNFRVEAKNSGIDDALIYQYIIANVYKNLIIEQERNVLDSSWQDTIFYIENTPVHEIVEEMRGNYVLDDFAPDLDDVDDFAIKMIEKFYIDNISITRERVKSDNLVLTRSPKKDICKALNPFENN